MHLSDESLHQLAQGLLSRGNSPGESAQRNESRDRVRVALNGLSEAYQNVLLLRHLEQLSVAETAQVLQIKEGTVKSRHYRALRSLNVLLADLEGDQP